MKMKGKERNCPRLANAIKRACAYAHTHVGWWEAFNSDILGDWIIKLAYGADKYDVLNALCPGATVCIITYARGDIRHSHMQCGYIVVFLLLILVVLSVTVKDVPF